RFQRIALGIPDAAVEDVDVAGAVVPLRNIAFEVGVADGVVLDLDRETFLACTQGRPLGHGPAPEAAVQLQAEVVVARPRMVQLDDEDRPPAALARRRDVARFRGFAEAALAGVLAQAHRARSGALARGRLLRCLLRRRLLRRCLLRRLPGSLLRRSDLLRRSSL